MKKYIYQNAGRLKDVRQFLRNNPTPAETILWQHLKKNQLGHKFRRQYSIGGVVADFCCMELKLVIELDGWTHEYEKTQIKDKKKQEFLNANGYKVIRFTNEQIYGDIEIVFNEIKKVCEERSGEYPSPALP